MLRNLFNNKSSLIYRILLKLKINAKYSIFLRSVRWWNEQLTPAGKAIITIWAISCIPASFDLIRPTYFISLGLGVICFTNYIISYTLVHLKVTIKRNIPRYSHFDSVIKGSMTVENIGMTHIYDLQVFERQLSEGLEQEEELYVPILEKGTSGTYQYQLKAKRRGAYIINQIIISTFYPFGIIRKIKAFRQRQEILVFPKLLEVKNIPLRANRKLQKTPNTSNLSYLSEMNEYIGNREYQFGDRLNDIDQKAWARFNRPITRVYKSEYEIKAAVLLDISNKYHFSQSEFENVISMTASIIKFLCINNMNFDFYVNLSDELIQLKNINHENPVFEALAYLDYDDLPNTNLIEELNHATENSNNVFYLNPTLQENIFHILQQMNNQPNLSATYITCDKSNIQNCHYSYYVKDNK